MNAQVGGRWRWRDVTVIAVVAHGDGAWQVVQEPTTEPLASFAAKEQALSFALSVARTRPNWRIYLRCETAPAERALLSDPGVAVASGENIGLPEAAQASAITRAATWS